MDTNEHGLRKNTVNLPNVSTVMNSRHKINSMQLEVYVQKIREYRATIDAMEHELNKFKKENDCLIDDLRESKTRVAVLEESKA